MSKLIAISTILTIIQDDYLATIEHLTSPPDVKLAKKLNKKGVGKLSPDELNKFVRLIYSDDALVDILVKIGLASVSSEVEEEIKNLSSTNKILEEEIKELKSKATVPKCKPLNIKFVGGNWVRDGKAYSNLDDAKKGKDPIEG